MATNRTSSPAKGCNLNQGMLLAQKQIPVDLFDDCPACAMKGISCQVRCHPTAAEQKQLASLSSSAMVNELINCITALENSCAVLEKRVNIGQDERMLFFSKLVSSSSCNHGIIAAETIWELYNACVVCGLNRELITLSSGQQQYTVTMAPIVSDTIEKEHFGVFGTPRYVDNLNTASIRNFIPLCGACHNEFDKHTMTFLYDPFNAKYKVLCLNKNWDKYDACNDKELELKHMPYRRLLAWRTRYCLQVNNYFLLQGRTDVDALITRANFSEDCQSVAEDSGEVVDSSAGSSVTTEA